MVKEHLDLRADGKAIELLIDNEDWCELFLVGSIRKKLGSDRLWRIMAHLMNVLGNRNSLDYCGVIQGQEVAWVLSLSDGHSSVYASSTDSSLVLYFEDQAGKILDKIRLSEYDCRIWSAILSGLKGV